jgi:hypothetical protein
MEEINVEYLKEILLKSEYQCHLNFKKEFTHLTTTENEAMLETDIFFRGAIFINLSQTTIDKIKEIIAKYN